MKIVKRKKLLKQSVVISEYSALQRLMHPNIIQLHEVIDDATADSIHLVLDLIDGGTLEDKIVKKLS